MGRAESAEVVLHTAESAGKSLNSPKKSWNTCIAWRYGPIERRARCARSQIAHSSALFEHMLLLMCVLHITLRFYVWTQVWWSEKGHASCHIVWMCTDKLRLPPSVSGSLLAFWIPDVFNGILLDHGLQTSTHPLIPKASWLDPESQNIIHCTKREVTFCCASSLSTIVDTYRMKFVIFYLNVWFLYDQYLEV